MFLLGGLFLAPKNNFCNNIAIITFFSIFTGKLVKMAQKKGYIFKSLKSYDGLALHAETFKEYLDSLPKTDNGWVNFAIIPTENHIYPKDLVPQLDATPKEVSTWLWENRKPGGEKLPLNEWLVKHRNKEGV